MTKLVSMMTAAALFGLLASAGAQAQHSTPPQEQGMRGMGMMHTGMYDPKSVETVSGEVVSVERITAKGGMMGKRMQKSRDGVHLVLKTGKETLAVHLGPAWFIDNQPVKIAPRDKIVVKGSRIVFEGKPAIVAAQVSKGDEVLTLRDAEGFPAWVGWRRR